MTRIGDVQELTVFSFCTWLHVGVVLLIGQSLRCNTDTYKAFHQYVCVRGIAYWPFFRIKRVGNRNRVGVIDSLVIKLVKLVQVLKFLAKLFTSEQKTRFPCGNF